MQVDPDTVASDSFMVNIQSVLYRFAEPFMDANYTKVGDTKLYSIVINIDPLPDRPDRSLVLRSL